MNTILKLNLLFFLFIISLSGYAQKNLSWHETEYNGISDSTEYVITLKSGTKVQGEIKDFQGDKVLLLSADIGELNIPKTNIQSVSIASSKASEQDERKMVGAFHNIVSSTAYNVPKGRGYIQSTMLFLISAGYGVSDNISLNVATSLLPEIPFRDQLKFFYPKLSYQVSDLLAISSFVGIAGAGNGKPEGLWGLTASIGKPERNISIGRTGSLSFPEVGVWNISGVYKVSPKIALLTDNFIGTYESDVSEPISFLGIRTLGNEGSFDFGFVYSITGSVEGAFPFISYTYRL